MRKNKIICSILMGLSFVFVLGSVSSASNRNTFDNVLLQGNITNDELEKFQYINILGNKYDLSAVNPSVIQAVIRGFDDINSNNLVGEDKNQKLKELVQLLDEYLANPNSFKDFPTTLDLGPSTFLKEEISYVQSIISALKNRELEITSSGTSVGDSDDKVIEIRNIISILSNWINYSVFNFESSKYERTFYDLSNKVDNLSDDVFSCVYSNIDFDNVFRIVINSDGSFDVQGEDISNDELTRIISSNLEFENYKLRKLKKEIDSLSRSRNSVYNVEDEIYRLEREIESVKAYGLSQEIVLLNMQKQIIQDTKISKEFMEEKLNDVQIMIDEKLDVLKDFDLNFEHDSQYFVDTKLGDKLSYFGYDIEGDNGIIVKVTFDEDGGVLFNGNYTISGDEKIVVRNGISNLVQESTKEISELELKKVKIASQNSDKKYYLLDCIDKRISVLKNNIENYRYILNKI